MQLIKPSLYNTHTGWGLDFTWPFLLRYPDKHIGVIDDVCMRHSQGAGEAKGDSNLYSVPAPYDMREEESRRVAEYGYYPSRVQAMGYDYRNIQAKGQVERSVFGSEKDGAAASAHAGESTTRSTSAFSWLRGAYGDANEREDQGSLHFNKKGLLAYIAVVVVAVLLAVSLVAAKFRQRRVRHGGQRRSSPKHKMTGLV